MRYLYQIMMAHSHFFSLKRKDNDSERKDRPKRFMLIGSIY